MDNYFNQKIVERHQEHIDLNNSMAECYSFCLGIARVLGDNADRAWYYDQKKTFICYDV